jgi:3-mercaptopyruvate sulfurtransferase SseA
MARSDVLVSTDWAESNLDGPNTVFVEVDEDTSAYDGGHIKARQAGLAPISRIGQARLRRRPAFSSRQ